MKFWKWAGMSVVVFFALIGLLFTLVFIGMRFGLLNVRGSIADRNSFFNILGVQTDACQNNPCLWQDTPEWATVREGLRKDAPVINRVSAETGVSARLIASVVVPEQLRFFTSEREIYKQVFEPLKILGSLSQFSLGISGIKQETALQIEVRVSPADAHLITYPATTTDHGTALFDRLTDSHNHYYSYLYTALFIKEVEAEWAKAGFPIDNKPEVIVTLFNIGFENSHPNAAPQVGGAPLTIGSTVYSFGTLGASFYHSAELTDVFPQ
jgi:hypothetical protein